MDRKIYAVYGGDPLKMAKLLLDAGRVAEEIPSGAGIALKPNLVVSRPAAGGATTHPEILAGIIEYLIDHGHRDIAIIEGSWVGDSTKRAFDACGFSELSRRYRVPLHDLKDDPATAVGTPGGEIRVCSRALRSGYLINVPVLKGHCQTRMTCALKNMKGCIPDGEKRRFHREGLDGLIAALGVALRPNLIVVDGICGDLDFEEGGNPVHAGRMFLGHDPVQMDAFGCRLMGLSPREVGYIGTAERYGAGSAGMGAGDFVELNRPDAAAAPRHSGEAARLGKGVREDRACSACYANLIHALKRMGGRKRPAAISIGQGWKGKSFDGFGVGVCCRGAEKSVPGCPPSATDILDALK